MKHVAHRDSGDGSRLYNTEDGAKEGEEDRKEEEEEEEEEDKKEEEEEEKVDKKEGRRRGLGQARRRGGK